MNCILCRDDFKTIVLLMIAYLRIQSDDSLKDIVSLQVIGIHQSALHLTCLYTYIPQYNCISKPFYQAGLEEFGKVMLTIYYTLDTNPFSIFGKQVFSIINTPRVTRLFDSILSMYNHLSRKFLSQLSNQAQLT